MERFLCGIGFLSQLAGRKKVRGLNCGLLAYYRHMEILFKQNQVNEA
jgi:hypothetical protein